jgi:RNA polymerase sigma factor (sigma-70 family)
VDAIISERNENGPYKDIFDFSRRVNLRSVNKKTFESLAMSGAFDYFEGYHRRQYMFEDENGVSLIEKAIRYGNKDTHMIMNDADFAALKRQFPARFAAVVSKAEEAFNRIDTSDSLLEGLTEKERKVISLRFGFDGEEPMTLEAIGQIVGVTRERIRQVESRALGKLRRRYLKPCQVRSGNLGAPGDSQ